MDVLRAPSLLRYYCEHAKLCSVVISNLYKTNDSKLGNQSPQSSLKQLEEALEGWRRSLLDATAPQLDIARSIIEKEQLTSRQEIELCLLYHELKFMIHQRSVKNSVLVERY